MHVTTDYVLLYHIMYMLNSNKDTVRMHIDTSMCVKIIFKFDLCCDHFLYVTGVRRQ